MQRADAPQTNLPIRQLNLNEMLIMLLVGQHHKRPKPVFLADVEYDMLPHPANEALDSLGAMGLLRNARNDRQQDIRNSVRVTGIGWVQVFNQLNRVVRKARQESAALRSKAQVARAPEDPKRRKDPAGGDDFENYAKLVDQTIERVERLAADVLPTVPVPETVRAALKRVDPATPAEDQKQADNTEEELKDAADPSLMDIVQVDGAPTGGDGLGDMAGDVSTEDMLEAPAPRQTRGKKS